MDKVPESEAPLGPFVPSPDQIRRVRSLSEMQRQCVELVQIGPSKIIAKRLGISHHTVDEYLKEACRRLGVSKRLEAAATVAAAMSDVAKPPVSASPQGWGDQTQQVAQDHHAAMIEPSDRQIDAERERDRVRDVGVVGLGAIPPIVLERQKFGGGERDRAPLAYTLNRILAYALIMAILAAAAVSIGAGFNDIGNFIETNVRHH